MRAVLLLSCLAACAFDPTGPRNTGDDDDGDGGGSALDAAALDGPGTDGAAIDAAAVDARVDALVIDARACPPSPFGCAGFRCTNQTGCYYVCSADTEPWNSANGRCQNIGTGGCLVTLNNTDEKNCVFANSVPLGVSPVWVGWRQEPRASEPSGGWGWACNGNGVGGSGWNGGEPDNSGGEENCAAMVGLGALSDRRCTEDFRYVCEVP